MKYFKLIFTDMLCAYRKMSSNKHAVIKLMDSWRFALHEHISAGTVLIDLSKAFDYVSYRL